MPVPSSFVEKAAHNLIADELTIRRARRGDTDAMADLWGIYHPQLLRLLAARGRPTAEDVASQVWIDVGRNLDQFTGDGVAFRSWIFTIAHRRAIDEVRRAARRREVAVRSISSRVSAVRQMEPLGESLDGVLALLSTLQPSAAEVVMLRVIHDLPVAEVAAITGQSESNVRVVAHRALQRLRQTIEDGGSLADAFAPVPRLV